MKVVYIGSKDKLAEAFIEKMNKEGNDTYFLSKEDIKGKLPVVLRHKFYKISEKKDMLAKIISSISPDNIVFAGNSYMDSRAYSEKEDNLFLLSQVLECTAGSLQGKFVYLSSCEVYGNSEGKISEKSEKRPFTKKGMFYDRGEYLVNLYRQRYGMNTIIVRTTQIYSSQCTNSEQDFLSCCFEEVIRREEKLVQNEIFQPIHVQDFAEAIRAIIESGKQQIYNVAGSFEVTKRELYEEIGRMQNIPLAFTWDMSFPVVQIDNSCIKKELEWTDFRQLLRLLENGEIQYKEDRHKLQKKEKKNVSSRVRRVFENIVIFIIFFLIYNLSGSHSLLSKIDWLLIYVMLISLMFGIRQSALAVLLASAGFLYCKDLSIFEMTNFYSYAESVLMIVEFVFFGICISYIIDMLKEDLRDTKRSLQMLQEEYKELQEINKENIMIKREYEKRILDSKSSIPKLYDLMKRLMVLQPDRIFMEILQVVAELIQTDTVAVYMANDESTYLRLINAMNEESVMGGKSWNIASYSELQEALGKGEMYRGNVWKGEPAITIPIMVKSQCRIVIAIKNLSYDNQTLYQMNLLRTLLHLLTESVERAFEYEVITKEERYVEGTEVLKPEYFNKVVILAQEKSLKNVADYCVLEITYTRNIQQTYDVVASKIRLTDYLGIDEQGGLFLLLGNTAVEEIENVKKRLAQSEIVAEVSHKFDDIGA